jgi:molecular chaperone DnaJ
LYNILGVPQSATDTEIKQAYFSLAKKYHPDVNKDPHSKNKFSEISSAYETLGSKEKRRVYDFTGKTGDDQVQEEGEEFYYTSDFYERGRENSVNLEDLLDEFEDILNERKKKRKVKGGDLKANVDISFMEAVNGVDKQVKVERKGVCGSCKGTKVKKGSAKSKCGVCKGMGIVEIDLGIYSVHQPCNKCKGEGYIIKSKCVPCKGTGLTTSLVQENISIPAGINTGYQLKFPGKGHLSADSQHSGDLFVKVSISPHNIFRRSGADIYSNIRITLPQSVLGGLVEIQTLEGLTNLKIDPGTAPGKVFRFVGQGVVNYPFDLNEKGDAIYTVIVETPKKLNLKQRELYEALAEDN